MQISTRIPHTLTGIPLTGFGVSYFSEVPFSGGYACGVTNSPHAVGYWAPLGVCVGSSMEMLEMLKGLQIKMVDAE